MTSAITLKKQSMTQETKVTPKSADASDMPKSIPHSEASRFLVMLEQKAASDTSSANNNLASG